MRSAVSERGGNASRAGERKQVWRNLNGHEGESRIRPRRTWSRSLQFPGGQGVHREVESEGHEEKYRAVVNGATQGRTGRPKVGQGRACTTEAKAFSFTHRTKVFADGTVRKNNA